MEAGTKHSRTPLESMAVLNRTIHDRDFHLLFSSEATLQLWAISQRMSCTGVCLQLLF
jgi:hypothetical protein